VAFSFTQLSATSTGANTENSHEKWKKEKSLDISTASRPEDNGPQKNSRRPNCKEVKTERRGDEAKGV
jgi:hypothetical protein